MIYFHIYVMAFSDWFSLFFFSFHFLRTSLKRQKGALRHQKKKNQAASSGYFPSFIFESYTAALGDYGPSRAWSIIGAWSGRAGKKGQPRRNTKNGKWPREERCIKGYPWVSMRLLKGRRGKHENILYNSFFPKADLGRRMNGSVKHWQWRPPLGEQGAQGMNCSSSLAILALSVLCMGSCKTGHTNK